ncbi:MAG: multidrug effflux MFS transporter [Alistipes sp.]|nr:multidrug effflux MFS transporter [Alistipes sp.]
MNKKTLVFILGNLTAFGPFITDFYLPCLPELTTYFGGSASLIQLSLTAGMLGLAVGQLLVGPVTDKYGRKRPLLWCLFLFVLATVACMLATDIRIFVLFRLLQGVTGASGLVVSKVIVTETFTGRDVGRYFAILAAVQGVAPVIAPVVGGVAFSLTCWQGAFAVLGIWGAALLLVCRRLRETLAEKDRLQMPVWKTFRCYVPVVRNGRYLIMNLLQSFSVGALMAYISASPFLFQQHFGLTPLQYSICFAGNALGLVVGSSVVMKIRNLPAATPWCAVGLPVAGLLVSMALWMNWPFWLFEVVLVAMLFCVGMITPLGITLALNAVTEHRGIASALLGALPFLLGGIVAPLTGLGDMIRSMTTLILLCSTICLCLYLVSRRWNYGAQPGSSSEIG